MGEELPPLPSARLDRRAIVLAAAGLDRFYRGLIAAVFLAAARPDRHRGLIVVIVLAAARLDRRHHP